MGRVGRFLLESGLTFVFEGAAEVVVFDVERFPATAEVVAVGGERAWIGRR